MPPSVRGRASSVWQAYCINSINSIRNACVLDLASLRVDGAHDSANKVHGTGGIQAAGSGGPGEKCSSPTPPPFSRLRHPMNRIIEF